MHAAARGTAGEYQEADEQERQRNHNAEDEQCEISVAGVPIADRRAFTG
jgi:hypothetical protein